MTLSKWKGKRRAKATAENQLKAYYTIRDKSPNLPKEEIYKQVLKLRPGYDDERAIHVITRAKESFSEWPYDGELPTFRQVVHYLVFSEHLKRVKGRYKATTIDFEQLINRIIPPNL